MGYGIALVGTDSAGGAHLGGGQSSWTLNGKEIVVLGDSVTPHKHGDTTVYPTMVQSSSWMSINGIEVVRVGHAASCGHTSTGQDWFEIPD